ncbi:hypothetical protein [Alicyclobacillus fodiniaquatilis]|uniref:Uncharacterized protein n=1 Tax=Alicyclobacillus fodiniaquatilis TaxID=1661150 RepID=A0ABW4JF00_9BACL
MNTNVSYRSKLIEHYSYTTPVSRDTKIFAFVDDQNQSKVFSIASNGHLFMLEKANGWSQLDLNYNGSQLTFNKQIHEIAVANDFSGKTHLVAVVTGETGVANELYYVNNFEAEPELERWIYCGRAENTQISKVNLGFDTNNKPFVMMITTKTSPAGEEIDALQMVDMSSNKRPYPWNTFDFTTTPSKILDVGFGRIEALGEGVFVSYINQSGVSYLEFNGLSAFHRVIESGKNTYSDLYALTTSSGSSKLFTTTDKDLFLLDENLGLTKIGEFDSNLEQFFAIMNESDSSHPHYYAKTKTGVVYHGVAGLYDPKPLLKDISYVSVDSQETLYCVDMNSKLFELIENPRTGGWITNEVMLQDTGQLESVKSYSTSVTLKDESGEVCIDASVQLTSSVDVIAEVNGQLYRVNSSPLTCATNAQGEIYIAYSTSQLAAVHFYLTGDVIGKNQRYEIQPNEDIQSALENITADQLLNAKRQDGTPLLTGDYRDSQVADAIAQTLNKTMSLGRTQPTTNNEHPERAVRLNTSNALIRQADMSHQLNFSDIEEQHWSIDFTSGKPQFESHTAKSISPFVTSAKAMASTPLTTSTANIMSSSSFGFSWGDLWESVKNGFIELGNLFVSTIVDPATKFVKSVLVKIKDIAGKVLWDGAVNFVDQVFDIAEGIFNTVKIFFKDLFDYLGFLFKWDDILRTHEVIKNLVNSGLDYQIEAVHLVQTKVNDALDRLTDNIEDTFDRAIQQVVGTKSLKVMQGDVNQAQGSNFMKDHLPPMQVQSQLMSFMSADKENGSNSISPGLTSQYSSFITTLQNYVNNLKSKSAFEDAIEQFKAALASPDQFLQSTFAGFLNITKGLALLTAEGFQLVTNAMFGVVQSIIQEFKNILNQEIQIPLITDLYHWATNGSPLTLLDTISLVVAIPTTILYKVIFNENPFRDSDAVTAFGDKTSKAKLLETTRQALAGNHQQQPRVAVQSSTEGDDEQRLLGDVVWRVAYISSIVVEGIEYFADALLDLIPMDAEKVTARFTKVKSWILMGIKWTSVSVGCPFFSMKTKDFYDPKGYVITGYIRWGADIIEQFYETIWLAAEGKLARYNRAGIFGHVAFGVFGEMVAVTLAVTGGIESEGNAWEYVENFLDPIPDLAKPLKLAEGDGDLALCGVDAFVTLIKIAVSSASKIPELANG